MDIESRNLVWSQSIGFRLDCCAPHSELTRQKPKSKFLQKTTILDLKIQKKLPPLLT